MTSIYKRGDSLYFCYPCTPIAGRCYRPNLIALYFQIAALAHIPF